MGKLSQQTFAILMIVFGSLLLAGNLLNIDTGAIFWPLVLIFAGAFMVLRASRQPEGAHSEFKLIGEIDRRGNWQAASEDMTGFFLELDLDFSDAELSTEHPQLQLLCFVSDITLRVPESLGLEIQANCFVADTNVFGEKQDYIMSGWSYDRPGTGANKLKIIITSFVSEINLVRA